MPRCRLEFNVRGHHQPHPQLTTTMSTSRATSVPFSPTTKGCCTNCLPPLLLLKHTHATYSSGHCGRRKALVHHNKAAHTPSHRHIAAKLRKGAVSALPGSCLVRTADSRTKRGSVPTNVPNVNFLGAIGNQMQTSLDEQENSHCWLQTEHTKAEH